LALEAVAVGMEQLVKYSPCGLHSSVTTLLQCWRELSRLFLAALPHSSDSSMPMGIGTESGMEGGNLLRLRPHCTGSAVAPGAHEETLSCSLVVPHLPLFLCQSLSLSSFIPISLRAHPPRRVVLIPHAMWYLRLSVLVFKFELRSLDALSSMLTAVSLPFEKRSFSLIPVFYPCACHYPSVMSICTDFVSFWTLLPDLVHSSNVSCVWQMLWHYFTWSRTQKVILHQL